MMKLSPGCGQHVGMRSEQQDVFGFSDMEDSSLVERAGVFAVLADGMGGMSLGRAAAEAVVEAALAEHQRTSAGTPAAQLLHSVVTTANQQVLAVAMGAGLPEQLGATLVAVSIKDDCLHFVSVGDSRIYLFRQGELVRLTEDQNLAGCLLRHVAAGTLDHAEVRVHPDRDSLTNFIGMPGLQPADANLRPFPLKPDDWLLLCSDGLFGTLAAEEISAELYGSPDEACERLIQKTVACHQPHQDNVTIMLLSCSDDANSAAVPPAGRLLSWWNRLLCSLFVAGTIFFGSTVSVRANLPIETMKAATVRVACTVANTAIDYGSGFITGSGELVVSSSHVVGCSERGGEVVVVTTGGQRFTATVIWTSVAKDLALMRLPGRANVTVPALVSSQQVVDAQTVYALGFPAAAVTNRESPDPVTISKGIISARMSRDNLKLYQTDAVITSGSSGGPLFNESGQIVGINFFKAESGAGGDGFAIQSDELLPELERFGVTFRTGDGGGLVAPGSQLKPSAPQPKPILPGGEPQKKSSHLYLAICLAVLLIVSVIVYLRVRRNARRRIVGDLVATPAVPGPVKAAPPTGTRPVLIGLTGVFAGNEIRLGRELLIIGRDPHACQLVFPADEKDIGRVHCSLRYDSILMQFILLDDLSINGTFLQSGERLLPERACRLLPGMRFYLASPVNTFEVRLF